MSILDWVVLVCTLGGIVAFGMYKTATTKNMEGYFLSNRSLPWYLVLLSIMGTQASAITFLSAPGQAYTDGMRFVQYYFGLPLAMVVLCISFVPLYHRLKVFTAYEFLEQRFDAKTRTFASVLFLLSRGLSTGVSIYAPSIILSSLLGWDIFYTNLVMGSLLVVYTINGGAKAVAYTQQIQMVIILGGMLAVGYYLVHLLPEGIGFTDALKLGGVNGKLNIITTGFTEKGFDWKDRYNIVSGLVGGFFLALSYFGTDQSQVGRYLTAKNVTQSRIGLLMNGLVKIPMQFLILLVGVLLFNYYQFTKAPIFFNTALAASIHNKADKAICDGLEQQYKTLLEGQSSLSKLYVAQPTNSVAKTAMLERAAKIKAVQIQYRAAIKKALPHADTNDTNYIFLRFVVDYLPKGLVGLLIAIIFMSAWGSIAAALNSLASCTMIDVHKRLFAHAPDEGMQEARCLQDYRISRYYTLAWGVFCIITAELSSGLGSLIEAVNIMGSLFYGVILGVFLVAFYVKRVGGTAVFIAAFVSELLVITLFTLDKYDVIGLGFLWLNVVGAVSVVVLGLLFSFVVNEQKQLA